MTLILHIDVNSAFLSWEAAKLIKNSSDFDPRQVASIVGGDIKKRKGIVLAKSIKAKNLGIKTGEPIVSALKKCPNLLILPPHYQLYEEESIKFIKLLKSYSDSVEQYSIDEAFVDIPFSKEDPYKIGMEIKDKIKKELGFTVNVGVSENKLLAKMASDFEKPDKVHLLFKNQIKEKMWPLEIGRLFMVGSRTEKKMLEKGIKTIGDLAKLDREYIYKWLKKPGIMLWEYANGIDNSKIISEIAKPKSIGNSTTLAYDIRERKEAELVILALSEKLAKRLRSYSLKTSSIHLSYRYSDFTSDKARSKLYTPTSSSDKIFKNSLGLFDKLNPKKPIRQMGIYLDNLSPACYSQLSFLEEADDEKKEILGTCIDEILEKYGKTSLKKAVFLEESSNPIPQKFNDSLNKVIKI